MYMAETALNQNWNRDYDPTVGRYLESDPVGVTAGVNTYGYVGADPVNLFDPQGLTQQDIDEIVCLARILEPDIKIPNPKIANLGYFFGSKVEGQVASWPWSQVYIDSMYLQPLNADQRIDLYNTIVHESWHWDQQPFYWRGLHPDAAEREAYAVANARTINARDRITGSLPCQCKKN